MPSVIDPGFGGNADNLIGEQAALTQRQIAFGEFRARTILAGNYGAVIESIHITPRTGLTASGAAFPAAGMFDVIGFIAANALDTVQNNFQQAQRDLSAIAERVFLMSPRSTLEATDIVLTNGVFIPPGKYGHVLCLHPRAADGTNISTYFNLTVVGRQITGTDLPYTLR